MDDIDDTDRAILELLLEDARRPFSEIAQQVELSGPAVSDRVERLQERGLIRRFTVDVDRSMLQAGQSVLVSMTVEPGTGPGLERSIAGHDAVEHCFRTVDDRIVATATVRDGDVTALLEATGVLDVLESYDVRLLADSSWSPTVGSAELAPACAECGNTVDDEGTTVTLEGTQYYFCCRSCESKFVDQYERLQEGV